MRRNLTCANFISFSTKLMTDRQDGGIPQIRLTGNGCVKDMVTRLLRKAGSNGTIHFIGMLSVEHNGETGGPGCDGYLFNLLCEETLPVQIDIVSNNSEANVDNHWVDIDREDIASFLERVIDSKSISEFTEGANKVR